MTIASLELGRFAGLRASRGKSGAFRICYVHLPEFGTIAPAVIFGKGEKDDLNAADCHAISAVVEAYRTELEREFGRRQPADRGKDRRKGDG
jgi:hypothetical protein